MIKKILDLFRRRNFVPREQKILVNKDLRKELEDREKKASHKLRDYRRKNMEIQALREILEESGDLYTESEINSIFSSIILETQKD